MAKSTERSVTRIEVSATPVKTASVVLASVLSHLGVFMSRISVPSFVAGAALSLGLMALPAYSLATGSANEAADPSGFDGTAPQLEVEPLTFAVGKSIDNTEASDGDCSDQNAWHYDIPLELNWSATDTGGGVESFDVLLTSRWTWGTVKDASETQETTWPVKGSNYTNDCGGGSPDGQYRVLARDREGNIAISKGSAHPGVLVWQENGASNPPSDYPDAVPVAKVGNWRQGQCACFDAGHTLYSSKGGNSLTYTLDGAAGNTAAVVMEKNSRKGKVGIRLNGGPVTVVDTYAASPQHRVIVWKGELSDGPNTLKITNQGTSGRPRVDVDAVMLVGHAGPGGEIYLDFPDR